MLEPGTNIVLTKTAVLFEAVCTTTCPVTRTLSPGETPGDAMPSWTMFTPPVKSWI